MAAPRTVRLRLRFADPNRGDWCGGCGRRRTPDGRCPRCDAWWASPLISIGLPIILACVVLLAIGIRVLRGSEQSAASSSRAERRAFAFGTFAPAMVSPRSESGAATDPQPFRFAEEPQPERPAARTPVRPRRITMAEQVRLREMSDYAHAVVAADDAARDRAKEEARTGVPSRASVEVHAAPFTPPTGGGSTAAGSLPLPGTARRSAPDPSAPASGFFETFAPSSAFVPSTPPTGNYAPGVPVPTTTEVR